MNEREVVASPNSIAALLAAGISLCKVQTNPHAHGRAFVLLPQANGDVKAEYLERPELPARKTGTVKVNDVESFIDMVGRLRAEDSSVIYASLQPLQLVAVLNDNQKTGGATGWRDHRVLFQLKHSKEYDNWLGNDGKGDPFSQEEFAYFIENNLPDFKAPPGAKMLDVALNFRAKQSISYKGGMRLSNGSNELSYTDTVEGAAGSTGKMQIPEQFAISIPVWAGLEQKSFDFDARLRYRIAAGSIAIWYDLERPHKVVEKAFADTLKRIENSLSKTPIVFGTPE